MSLERIKKYCENIVKTIKVLIILILVIIGCEIICFMWQALLPGKLIGFFNIFRIYSPFISNIDNNALCLFELSGSMVNNIFIFMMLYVSYHMFQKLAETVSLSKVTYEMKILSLLLIADAIAVPVVKVICYWVFVKLPVPSGMFDMMPIAIGAILYFVAIIIQSKAVLKENQE